MKLFLVSLAAVIGVSFAQELSDAQVDLVGLRLAEGAQRSWELGARTQAILESNATRYSVFAKNDLPPPQSIPGDQYAGLQPIFDIARQVVSERGDDSGLRPLAPNDPSAADSASLGLSVLLANWTFLDSSPQSQSESRYAAAATSQVRYLLEGGAPKSTDGAISHRQNDLQLWSDSTYMLPPFLAYYGVLTRNKTVVEEAFNQIKLARNHLRDGNSGVWKHAVVPGAQNGGGGDVDGGLWATGNGWAAAGMLRVYATIDRSEYSGGMGNQLKDLKKWVREIHEGVYEKFFDGESLVHNYLNDSSTFYDASASALLASTVYRASTLFDEHHYIPFAERTRLTLFTPNGGPGSNNGGQGTGTSNTSFNNYEYFTTDGWLRPVVNPTQIGSVLNDGRSAEAQAFVVSLHESWKEWRAEGEEGKNAASSMRERSAVGVFVGLVIGTLMLLL